MGLISRIQNTRHGRAVTGDRQIDIIHYKRGSTVRRHVAATRNLPSCTPGARVEIKPRPDGEFGTTTPR